MLVTKQEKHLTKFLNMVYKEMEKFDDVILFVENNEFYFGSFGVSGKLELTRNEESLYQDIKDGFYTMSKLPSNKLKITKLDEVNEDMTSKCDWIKKQLNSDGYLINIEAHNNSIVSTITRSCGVYVMDSRISMILKTAPCELKKIGHTIMTTKREFIDKENINMITTLLFSCREFSDVDFEERVMDI